VTISRTFSGSRCLIFLLIVVTGACAPVIGWAEAQLSHNGASIKARERGNNGSACTREDMGARKGLVTREYSRNIMPMC